MTPQLKLQSNGRYWCACWRSADGKRQRRSLGSKATVPRGAAEAALFRLQARLIHHPVVMPSQSCTLQRWEITYFALRPDISKGTAALHARTFRYLMDRMGHDASLAAIGKGHAAAWRAWLYTQGIGEQTICCHVRNAKTIFSWAIDSGLIDQNPFSKLVGTPPRIDTSRRDRLDRAMIDTLLCSIYTTKNWELYKLVAICAFAGLRLSEALRIEWDDIQADRLVVRTGKTERRVVRLESEVSLVLGFYTPVNLSAILVNLTPSQADKSIRKAFIAAGVSWRRPFQALRDWRDVTWREKYPAWVVCSWMGHSDKVSREYYLSVPKEHYDETPAS